MNKKLRLTALSCAVFIGMTGCFFGNDSNNSVDSFSDLTEVANQNVSIEVYSNGMNESVELVKQDGTVVATTTPTEEGILAFDQLPSLPANTPLIANIKDAEGNISLQALYSAGEVQDGIRITPATTLITKMLDNLNTDVLTKRDELIAQMSELGMITAEGWSALESEVFDNDSLYGYVSLVSAEDLDNFVTEIQQEVADKDISSFTMQAGFPNAHGGIASLMIINDGQYNFMSSEKGQIIATPLTFDEQPLLDDEYSLTLEDAPAWMSINEDGIIKYQAPEVANHSNRETFTIIATPKSGATPKKVSVSYAIDPVKVLLEGSIGPEGGKIENDWKDIYLTAEEGALSQEYQIKYLASSSISGNLRYRFSFSPSITDADAEKLGFVKPVDDLIFDNYFKVSNSESTFMNSIRNNSSQLNGVDEDESKASAIRTRDMEKCQEEVDISEEFRNSRYNYIFDNNIKFGKRAHYINLSKVNPQTRVPEMDIASYWNVSFSDVEPKCSSVLISSTENDEAEPVLFVHGFIVNGDRGDASYWGAFPKMISELDISGRKFQPYLFNWRTNARFDDVSNELAEAIKKINHDTGKKVHIIAHSYGGVLTRTLVQGLSQDSERAMNTSSYLYTPDFSEARVASITTVGTPHSGISNGGLNVNGVELPVGRHKNILDENVGGFIKYCQATTCLQAGKELGIGTIYKKYADQGRLIADLSEFEYPSIPTQVLIGIKSEVKLKCDLDHIISEDSIPPTYAPRKSAVCNLKVHKGDLSKEGDGLISYYGQRFRPDLKQSSLLNGPIVFERILNFHNYTPSSVSNFMSGDSNTFNLNEKHSVTLTYNKFVSDKFKGFLNVNDHVYNRYKHTSPWDRTSSYNDMWFNDSNENYVQFQTNGVLSEVGLENCKTQSGYNLDCNHGTWRYLKRFLESNPSESVSRSLTTVATGEIGLANSYTALNANNNQSLSTIDFTKARISVLSTLLPGNLTLANGEVNPDGTFSIPVEFKANSLDYAVQVSMPGYRSVIVQGSDVQISVGDTPEESNLDFGEIVLQPNELVLGDLGFNIIDAFTGEQVNGFDITATNYVGNTFEGENGVISQLPRGTYNVTFKKEGFADSTQQCVVNAYSSNVCRVAVMSLNQSSQDLVSVLRWGQDPYDLDTHMIKYDANGNKVYQIYYGDQRNGEPDNLDLDDTDSFGPETLSIESLDPTATYVYAVHHYSGSGTITSTSEARVAIGQRGKQPRILYAPTSGEGIWWKVYEVRNNTVYPCQSDCMFDSTPTLNNANSSYSYQNNQPRWLLDMSRVINNYQK